MNDGIGDLRFAICDLVAPSIANRKSKIASRCHHSHRLALETISSRLSY